MVPQGLYDNLEAFKDFDVENNTENFLNTVDTIIAYKDPSSIPILIRYFDDNSDYDWVFESLMLALEYYDETTHIKVLLENLPILISNAPLWANDIFNRILNEENCKKIFIENLYCAPKGDIQRLFNIIENESPHHRELIQELRDKLDDGIK